MSLQFSGSYEVDRTFYKLRPKKRAYKLAEKAKAAFQKHAAEIEALPPSVKLEFTGAMLDGYFSDRITVSMQLRDYLPTDENRGLIEFSVFRTFFQSTEKLIVKAIKEARECSKNRNII